MGMDIASVDSNSEELEIKVKFTRVSVYNF